MRTNICVYEKKLFDKNRKEGFEAINQGFFDIKILNHFYTFQLIDNILIYDFDCSMAIFKKYRSLSSNKKDIKIIYYLLHNKNSDCKELYINITKLNIIFESYRQLFLMYS